MQGVFTESLVGKPGTPDGQRVPLRAGVWRYHPMRHEFEVFATGGSNQWGIDFNEAGHLFMTHCRSFHGGGGTTHIIRNGHYWNQANADYAPFVSNKGPAFAPGLKNYLPSSARYDSGEGGAGKPGTTAVYGGHSHVGTMIYLGDNWPDIYRDHLFTHNLHGHQINQQHNVRQGSGYETFHAGFDMMFTPDLTFVAVDLQYGPDGAVYMIDWCDHQHCHSPRDDIWERTNGRVYRVSWAETWRPIRVDLAAKSDVELAALHTHRNEWFVRTARRLLQERAASRPLDPKSLDVLRHQASESSEISQVAPGDLHPARCGRSRWRRSHQNVAASQRPRASMVGSARNRAPVLPAIASRCTGQTGSDRFIAYRPTRSGVSATGVEARDSLASRVRPRRAWRGCRGSISAQNDLVRTGAPRIRE